MWKKRMLALGFSLVLALGVAACNGEEFEEAPNGGAAPEAPADDQPTDDI